MNHTRLFGLAATTAAVLGLVSIAPLSAAQERQEPAKQEPAKEDPAKQEGSEEETDLRELNPFAPPGGAGGPEQMEQLFLTVEKRLQRVTDLLYEASSGDMSGAEGIGGAGIDELIRGAESSASGASSGMARMLEATRGQSEATLNDIEKILELAEQQSSSSSSGGGQSQSAPKPSDGDPQQGQTPSGSRKEEKGERPPQPGGQEPQQPQEEQQQPGEGDDPKGNQESESNQDGEAKAPPGSETGDPAGASGAEEWGDLPIHLRKVFQNGVSDDVPPRYRDWVDSYYKRLNRRSGR